MIIGRMRGWLASDAAAATQLKSAAAELVCTKSADHQVILYMVAYDLDCVV